MARGNLIFKGLDAIAWINLDRAKDRRLAFETMLSNYNINASSYRLSAWDGAKDLPVETDGLCSRVKWVVFYRI